MTDPPHPINPWLAKKVAAFRKSCPDEQALRVRYRSALKEYPDMDWKSFILEEALNYALPERPASHLVELADIGTFKWAGKKGKIGF